jgi:hypothetical protein
MPSFAISRLAGAAVLTAALGMGSSGPKALACGLDCREYRPAPVYYAPPVYSYTYGPYGRYAAVHYRIDLYTTRVNIFRGPRWGYAAAYYNPVRHGGCGRGANLCHRAYIGGPILRAWRRW